MFSHKKIIGSLTLTAVFFQLLFPILPLFALDPNGTANLDLYVTPVIPSSSIIGKGFSLDVNLENKNTSEGDAFNPGVILSLPVGVSLVSGGALGAPTHTVNHASGGTLVFFRSNMILLKGTSTDFQISLTSNNAAGVFILKDIGVLAYADDSIYGRGAAPGGSPPGTLSGGVDYAAGSGVFLPDPNDSTFPNGINASTNLSSLPFVKPTIVFTPFDIIKTESSKNLIGKNVTTTLTVEGNSMGTLRHFHLQDVVPSNRAFIGFITSTGANVGGLRVTYNSPSPGLATIDVTDITVPANTDVSIQYQTLPLAYDISYYSGSTPVLDTASVVPHNDPSPNTVRMHTGGLALSGGPYSPSTWNNGTTDILVDATSILPPRTKNSYNRYVNLSKSSDKSTGVRGDVITYTIDVDTALNVDLTSNGSGTYILDTLADGLTYSGTISSVIVSGTGTPMTFESQTVSSDGDTTIIWRLTSGTIGPDSKMRLTYQAVIDGNFEGAGDTTYESTDRLLNQADLVATFGDSGLSGIWGETDPSIIDTQIEIQDSGIDIIQSNIAAPIPTSRKQLVSITTPSGSVYDYTTGLPSVVPVGSALRFALSLDFPDIDFINPKIIDALPLLAGPNTSAYNISFQTDTNLRDIYNTGVLFNTNDGISPSSNFNGLTLLGNSIPNAPWIITSPANNLEFQLNSGSGKKTFSILFTVNILPTEPSGGVPTNGLVPLTNFAYSSYQVDTGSPKLLPVTQIPFTVDFPSLTLSKTASGGANVEAGKDIEYTIVITNTGSASAFIDNIIDIVPSEMALISGAIMSSGSLVPLSNSIITQSGTTLSLSFSTGASSGGRSLLPIDDIGTPGIKENIVVIRYTLRPTSNFVIQGGSVRTNTITLDYYASSGALSSAVNNLGPLTANANIAVKNPTFSRSVLATSESDSTSSNLYVGEEVTYRTILTLPQGTYTNSQYSEAINSNLEFISGSVIAYSGAISFSSGTVFSGSILPLGTIINNDGDISTLETVIIDTTYRVRKTANPGTNYLNTGTFSYSSRTLAANVGVSVRKPTLTLSKVATPTTGQYGTTINYTITVNNTSTTAHAYDISVSDMLPTDLEYISGSLIAVGSSGSEWDLFMSGITYPSIVANSGVSFTFQAKPKTQVYPTQILINNVSGSYDTLDDDGSLYEWTGSISANATFSISDIGVIHTITSTDLSDTTSSLFSGSLQDLTIGERVVYDTVISIPESSFTGFTITQTLPLGMKFTTGSVYIDGIKSHTLMNVVIGPDNQIVFSLGNVDNTGTGAGSGVTLRTEAVVQDNVANTAGSLKNSNISISYGMSTKNAGPVQLEVVEPVLSVTKVYTPNSGDAGDPIPTTITIQNIGSVAAYDVVLTDISAQKTTPTSGYSGSISIGTLLPGETRSYTYDSVIDMSATPGEMLTGTASIVYTSYPGSPAEGERTYTANDNDYISVTYTGSITVERISAEPAKIGDTVSYQIRVPVSEGNTNQISIIDIIPSGMAILPSSVSITTSPSITYSGAIQSAGPESTAITSGQSQTLSYTFTGIVNTDIDNGATEYIYIDYDAIVLNTADTNRGNTIAHTAAANYNSGAVIMTGTSLPITIIEPYLDLDIAHTYVYGQSVLYTFTLTNTGTATAYDIDLSTLLSPYLSYTGTLSLVSSGGALGLTQVGDHFTVTELPVNTGNPLVFTIAGSVSDSAPDTTIEVLTGSIVYTSQPGTYSDQIGSPLNRERSSGGGVDDYYTTDVSTAFVLALPLLDQSISVTDINGGDAVISDVFEYTITLVNTGSTNLSQVPVIVDIPAGFTGLTVTSFPSGSEDISMSTGGAYNAGQLSISGITIPLGTTRTIVYRVRALPSLSPGTTLMTVASVGDSTEGARGGSPSVPVTIQAPILRSSAIEVDRDAATYIPGNTASHEFVLSNSGTATGTDISITLTWSSGATLTGTLITQTGTLIQTGTLVVDPDARTMTFIIPALPPGAVENFRFITTANGPIGTSITSYLTADTQEGVETNAMSNTLVIVSPKVPGGGGTGLVGPSTPQPVVTTPSGSGTVKEDSPINPPTPINPTNTKPITQKKKNNPADIESVYKDYLRKLARYKALEKEEVTPGTLGITYPKLLPKTGKAISDRVKRLSDNRLSLDPPVFELGGQTLESYLKNLPEIDRNRDEYIVLPSNGMITPINNIEKNSPDFQKFISGREVNVNPLLRDGVLHYPGTTPNGYGKIGNTVIFGHSSYFSADSGRYKTHFQKIIELEKGEEIWVFQKNESGTYKKYRYRVENAFDTPPSNVSLLGPGVGKNLTLFTCTPIGGITGRWIVQAKFVDEEKQKLGTILYGIGLKSDDKKALQTFLDGLKSLPETERKSQIREKFTLLSTEKRTPTNQYFLYQLAKAYQK